MRWNRAALLLAACSFTAAAAPRIDNLAVKPNPAAFAAGKAPEVEIVVGVSRAATGPRDCGATLDLGDGSRPRQLDFGVATTRSLRHTYKKGGSYRVTVKGAGKLPCEGSREVALAVTGAPEPAKKPPVKKDAPKKEAPKKKDVKKDVKKKDEKKKDTKKDAKKQAKKEEPTAK